MLEDKKKDKRVKQLAKCNGNKGVAEVVEMETFTNWILWLSLHFSLFFSWLYVYEVVVGIGKKDIAVILQPQRMP